MITETFYNIIYIYIKICLYMGFYADFIIRNWSDLGIKFPRYLTSGNYPDTEVRDVWQSDTMYQINRHGKISTKPGDRTSHPRITNLVFFTTELIG